MANFSPCESQFIGHHWPLEAQLLAEISEGLEIDDSILVHEKTVVGHDPAFDAVNRGLSKSELHCLYSPNSNPIRGWNDTFRLFLRWSFILTK